MKFLTKICCWKIEFLIKDKNSGQTFVRIKKFTNFYRVCKIRFYLLVIFLFRKYFFLLQLLTYGLLQWHKKAVYLRNIQKRENKNDVNKFRFFLRLEKSSWPTPEGPVSFKTRTLFKVGTVEIESFKSILVYRYFYLIIYG